MTKQKLLDLIDSLHIVELFAELDSLNISSNVFNGLREEFIIGNTSTDYYKRLKVFVGTLKLPEPAPIIRELQRQDDFMVMQLQSMTMDKLPTDIASQLDGMTDYDRKLFITKFKELQDQVNKNLNRFFTHDIFETIISPNVPLLDIDKNKLYAISSSAYKDEHISWVEKCLIVSALSISFVNKYDALRLDLLLSFVFGYEEKVWQRALVGVILGLYKRDKIARGDQNIYAKFEQLKDLTHVQEAIYHITIALETERYKKQEIPDFFKEEQNSEFFQKPQHWFLPFDEHSTWVKSALEKAIEIHNFDYIGFQAILGKTVGLLDTEKYALCFSLPHFSEKQVEQKIKELEDFYQRQQEASKENTWVYAHFLRNLLADLYRFHLLYPKANLRKIFEEQISIAETAVLDLLAEPQNKQKIEMDRWEEIGETCREDKNYEKAIVVLQKAVQLKPQSASAWLSLASANYFINQHEKAIEFYQKVVEIKPDRYFVWYLLGLSYANSNLKDYTKAIESFQKTIEIKPYEDFVWIDLGNMYANLQNYEKAIESYQKAIEINPENDSAWYNLGLAYTDLKNYEKAIESYEKAIEIKPDDEKFYYFLGFAYYFMDTYQKQIETYQKLVEINPNYKYAWSNLGFGYVRLGEFEKAIPYFHKELENYSQADRAIYNLGICYCGLKDKSQTLNYLQQAITLNPEWKEEAKTDTDFEWLWEDADFKALVA